MRSINRIGSTLTYLAEANKGMGSTFHILALNYSCTRREKGFYPVQGNVLEKEKEKTLLPCILTQKSDRSDTRSEFCVCP